jgi:hypothetical protein
MSQAEAVAFLEKSHYYLQRHLKVRHTLVVSMEWSCDLGLPLHVATVRGSNIAYTLQELENALEHLRNSHEGVAAAIMVRTGDL